MEERCLELHWITITIIMNRPILFKVDIYKEEEKHPNRVHVCVFLLKNSASILNLHLVMSSRLIASPDSHYNDVIFIVRFGSVDWCDGRMLICNVYSFSQIFNQIDEFRICMVIYGGSFTE